jgi:hypothetical protein
MGTAVCEPLALDISEKNIEQLSPGSYLGRPGKRSKVNARGTGDWGTSRGVSHLKRLGGYHGTVSRWPLVALATRSSGPPTN